MSHLVAPKAFRVSFFAKSAPEFVWLVSVEAEAESAFDFIVRQSVVDNHRFPFTKTPKEKLENSRVISIVK